MPDFTTDDSDFAPDDQISPNLDWFPGDDDDTDSTVPDNVVPMRRKGSAPLDSARESSKKASAVMQSMTFSVPDIEVCKETLELELDTVGTVQRFGAHYGDRFKYCPEIETWFEWDDQVYRADVGELNVQRAMLTVARSFKDVEAPLATVDHPEIKRLREREATAKKLVADLTGAGGSAADIKKAEDEAESVASALKGKKKELMTRYTAFSDRAQYGTNLREALKAARVAMAVPEREWGGPDDMLNTQSGVVCLRTGAVRPHDQSYRFTQITPGKYDPSATSAVLEKILDHLSASRPEVIEMLQRFYGTGATGSVTAAAILYLYGESQVGKSTLNFAVARALGEGFDEALSFAMTAKPAAFNKSGSAHDEGFHQLRPARFVNVDETGAGMLDALKLNLVTGGAMVSSRATHGRDVKWKPRMTIAMSANPKALIAVENKGLQNRFIPYEVTQKIPEAERTDAVKQALNSPAGMEAVLAWLVAGAIKWYADGANHAALRKPALIEDEKASYTSDMDVVQSWLDENCILVDKEHATGFPPTPKQAWEDFRAYVRNAKFPKGAFFESLADKGLPRHGLDGRFRWHITAPNGQRQSSENTEAWIPGLFLKNSFEHAKVNGLPLGGNVPLNKEDMPLANGQSFAASY